MNEKGRLLTFELSRSQNEIHIHCDKEGVALLRKILEYLSKSGGHEHLMTPSWGGNELTEERQGSDGTVMNKVTIHMW